MKKNNIALIGFMGVGKTLVSKKLGELLNRKVVSSDKMIIDREGLPIADIFTQKGEAYFRLLEKKVIKEILGQENIIIDCGGGVVLDQNNLQALKDKCLVIYLAADASTIYENIKHKSHRPLLNVENPKKEIQDLLMKREPYYLKAQSKIDTNGKTIDQIADEVLKIIYERS